MRGIKAKALRQRVRGAPAPLQMEYARFNGVTFTERVPLPFRYPPSSAQAEYKALKLLYRVSTA